MSNFVTGGMWPLSDLIEVQDSPFLDWSEPGPTATALLPYNPHTRYVLHNGSMDSLSEIWGARANSTEEGWVDYTAYPQGYVQVALDGYHYRTESALRTTTFAGFATRVFRGQTSLNSNSSTSGPNVPGWEVTLGPHSPQPGHESHTGGEFVTVPVGDFELVSYWHARRDSHPKNIGSARLFNYDPYPSRNYVIDFLISSDFYSPTSPNVNVYLLQGTTTQSGPATGFSTVRVASDYADPDAAKASFGEVWLDPALGLDIGYKVGELGCVADGQWTPYYCNLDPRSTNNVGVRYPDDPTPNIDFLFCPFHLGLVFLDTFKTGYVPVQDSVDAYVSGVEITFPTAPGWGWDADHYYRWLGGGQSDTAPDLTTQSYSVAGFGGVLQITAVSGEDLDPFAYQSAQVHADYNDPAQVLGYDDWAFDFCGYMFGDLAGVGNYAYGPALEVSFGGIYFQISPGDSHINYGGYAPNGNVPVDPMLPFHVRMQRNGTVWATKIWQDGPAPSQWNDWFTQTPYRPSNYPVFTVWADISGGAPSTTFGFVCTGYKVWDLRGTTDPLVFVDYDVPPTGGTFDDSESPCGGAAETIETGTPGSVVLSL